MKKYPGFVFIILLFLMACQPEVSYIYELEDVEISSDVIRKTRRKSDEQYIAILYSNLYQKAISANHLGELMEAIHAVGDKDLSRKLVVQKFLASQEVKITSYQEMKANPEQFILETYERFLLRRPTEAEKTYLKNLLEQNPQITPDMVYFSFVMSEEYLHY